MTSTLLPRAERDGPLTVEVITELSGLVALSAEWDELESQTFPRVPFTSSTWNLLWWQHLHANRLLIRDRLHSFALRNIAGELVAVAPMLISNRPGLDAAALRVRVLQFFGADANVTEMRGMVCHPEYQNQAMAAMLTWLIEHKDQWDWVEWQGLTHLQQSGLPAPDTYETKLRSAFYLPLPGSWEALKADLPRNTKEGLRKCVNTLKRDALEAEFAILDHPDDVEKGLIRMWRLHRLRAKHNDGIPHADAFRDRRSRDFLLAYAHHAAARDYLRVFQIKINNDAIASRIGFVCDNHLYLYYSGYEPSFGKYSIMTTLMMHILQWAIEQGFDYVNLSTGRDQSKLRWRPVELQHENATQVAPTVRSRRIFKAYRYLRGHTFLKSLTRKQA